MSAAGIVHIALHCNSSGDRVEAAHVTLQRPAVTPLLIGRSPAEAVELVGTLHAVCGAAHRLAASRAIEDARRGAMAADAAAAGSSDLERQALAGIAFDQLCRLYIDWPEAIGLPPRPSEVLAWRRRIADPRAVVDALDIEAVRRHARTLIEVVPAAAGIQRRLRRRARETLASLTAIKLEAGRPGKIRRIVTPAAVSATRGPDAATGELRWDGEGRTITARGELIHRVSLARDGRDRETVAAWQIDAPTDRLFGPGGPVASALVQLCGDPSSLRRLARFVVLSFDPCVESQIEIRPSEASDARDVTGPGNP